MLMLGSLQWNENSALFCFWWEPNGYFFMQSHICLDTFLSVTNMPGYFSMHSHSCLYIFLACYSHRLPNTFLYTNTHTHTHTTNWIFFHVFTNTPNIRYYYMHLHIRLTLDNFFMYLHICLDIFLQQLELVVILPD